MPIIRFNSKRINYERNSKRILLNDKKQIVIKVIVEGSRYPQFHTSSVLISLFPTGINILFDPGFQYDQELLLNGLRKNNLRPNDIDYVILSHWHIDHCGLLSLFPSAQLIISSESIKMIEKSVNGIKKAEEAISPVDYLTDYIRNEIMTQEIINGLKDDISKIRAMANLTYRIRNSWLSVLQHYHERSSVIVEQEEFNLEENIIIIKFSAHTKGDLVVKLIDDDNRPTLLVGDILPFEPLVDLNNLPMLSEDKENYQNALNYICQSGNMIIPGHRKAFIF